MPYSEELRWADVVRKMEISSRTLLREVVAGEETYQDLIKAQDSRSNLVWGRILFNTADTEFITLVVDATAKTVSGPAGGGYFSGFRVGRDVFFSGFTNGGNNQTTEITGVSSDTITIADATGLVDETDTVARAQENSDSGEIAFVAGLLSSMAGLHDLYLAFTNNSITASDIAGLLRDFS